VIALGVKETAIVIPVLGWLVWGTMGSSKGRARRLLIVMTGAALVYVGFRALAGVPSGFVLTPDRYFAKQLIVEPFATLGQPWSAVWMRSHGGVALGRAIVIVILLAAAFWFWRRRDAGFRVTIALAAWVLVAVLPVFTFFHVSATLEGSRYLYLPAAGFSMLLAGLIDEAARRGVPGGAGATLALLVTCFMIPSIIAIRGEAGRWSDAARLRDAILASFVETVPPGHCGGIVAQGFVDNVNGAYVLRNGFPQALATRGHPPLGAPAAACTVSWTDRLLVTKGLP
jgi:hypothetical protein